MLVSVQLSMRLKEAHNMTAREESLEVAIGNYRELVNIIPPHHLEGLEGRSVWRNGADLAERPHHGLDAGLLPAIARDFLDFMGRDETNDLIVVNHDVTAQPAAQQKSVDKILQAQIWLYGRAATVHDIGDGSAAKLSHQTGLGVACASCVEQEPANKCQPKAAKVPALGEELEQSEKNDRECDGLADLRCQSRGAVGVSRNPPDYRAQNTAAVERIAGNHVERGECEID